MAPVNPSLALEWQEVEVWSEWPDLGEACQASEHPQVACRVQGGLFGQVASIRRLRHGRYAKGAHIWTPVEGPSTAVS